MDLPTSPKRRALEIARTCAGLGGRLDTVAHISRLPASFVSAQVFDDSCPVPRGRPTDLASKIFQYTLREQAGWCAFASSYRHLTDQGAAPEAALTAAYRLHREVNHDFFTFDKAYTLASHIDGRWQAPEATLDLTACSTCGEQYIIALGDRVPPPSCPLCRMRAQAKQAPRRYNPSACTATERTALRHDPVRVSLYLDALALRDGLVAAGAHKRVTAALLSAMGTRLQLKSLQPTEPSFRRRPIKPRGQQTWQTKGLLPRVGYALVTVIFARLMGAGVPAPHAMLHAYRELKKLLRDIAPSFDQCFDVVSCTFALWGVEHPLLTLTQCGTCHTPYLVADEGTKPTPAPCPHCVMRRNFRSQPLPFGAAAPS